MVKKTIKITQGDITEAETDAIVNAANGHLWMGLGVAGAIKRKGGDEIEREAISKGPISVGEAVATGAGKLPQKFVIHAATMGPDLKTDETKIRNASQSALEVADELGLESIAMPALGTGVGDFSIAEAARVMIEEAKEFLRNSKTLLRIEFVLFTPDAFESFLSELGATMLGIDSE